MSARELRAALAAAALAVVGLGAGCTFARAGAASDATIVDGEREDHRCGPRAGGEPCGPGRCCSAHGWCGSAGEAACGREHGFDGAYDGSRAPVAAARPRATLRPRTETHLAPAPPTAAGEDWSGVWTLTTRYRARSSQCDPRARVDGATYTATIAAGSDATVRLEDGETVQTLRGWNGAGGLSASNTVRLKLFEIPTETTTTLNLTRMDADGRSGSGEMTTRIVADNGSRHVDCLVTFSASVRRR